MCLWADERPREDPEAAAGRVGGGGATREGVQAEGAAWPGGHGGEPRDPHQGVQQPTEQTPVSYNYYLIFPIFGYRFLNRLNFNTLHIDFIETLISHNTLFLYIDF